MKLFLFIIIGLVSFGGPVLSTQMSFINIVDYASSCGSTIIPATCIFNAAIDDANAAAIPQGSRIYVPDGASWIIDAPLHPITAPNVTFFSLGAAELSVTGHGTIFTWTAGEGGGLDNFIVTYPNAPTAGDKLIAVLGGARQRFERLRLDGVPRLIELGDATHQFAHVAIKDIEGHTFDSGEPLIRVFNGAELLLDHVWLYNQIAGQGLGRSGTDFIKFDGPLMDTAVLSNVNVWGYDHCFMIDAALNAQILDIWLNSFIGDYCGFAGLELWAHGGIISGVHVSGQSWFTAYGNQVVQPIGAVFLEADSGAMSNVTLNITVPQTKGHAVFAIAQGTGAIRDFNIASPSNFTDWGFAGAPTSAVSLNASNGGVMENAQVGPGLTLRGGGYGLQTYSDGLSFLSARLGVNRSAGLIQMLINGGGTISIETGP